MTRRHAVLWLCMLALMAAQALAFMHRIVHAPQASASLSHAHPGDWVHELFSAHEDDSTCRLLDSVSHDALPTQVSSFPSLMPAHAVVALSDAQYVARRADLFQARGPPVSSFA